MKKLNPSTCGMEITPGPWKHRPSIKARLTIYSESIQKPICTILHADRITPADLQLILAAPKLLRALIRLRHIEIKSKEIWDSYSQTDLDAAIEEANEALAAAGIQS